MRAELLSCLLIVIAFIGDMSHCWAQVSSTRRVDIERTIHMIGRLHILIHIFILFVSYCWAYDKSALNIVNYQLTNSFDLAPGFELRFSEYIELKASAQRLRYLGSDDLTNL